MPSGESFKNNNVNLEIAFNTVWNYSLAIFLLISVLGSMYAQPDDIRSPVGDFSMTRWHPKGELTLYFGVNRLMEMIRKENKNQGEDDILGDDEVDDEFNWYFHATDYSSCVEDGKNGLSAELCDTCNKAGDEMTRKGIAIIVILGIVQLLLPALVLFMPSGRIKRQATLFVVINDPYIDEQKIVSGEPVASDSMENWMSENFWSPLSIGTKVMHIVWPLIFMSVVSSMVQDWSPCHKEIKDIDYYVVDNKGIDVIKGPPSSESLSTGAAEGLLIAAAVMFGIQTLFNAGAVWCAMGHSGRVRDALKISRMEYVPPVSQA